MTNREDRVLVWLIPGLMSATLGLVGWMGINISRMSESLAVVLYRIETQAAQMRDVESRVRFLESYAVLKGKPIDSHP